MTYHANGAIIAKVTAILALSDTLLWSRATDLTKWTVAVRPTAWPAHILLTVLSCQTVSIIETYLDTHPGICSGVTGVFSDTPLTQSTVSVSATLLQTHISDTAVLLTTAGAVTCWTSCTTHWCPHTPMLWIW